MCRQWGLYLKLWAKVLEHRGENVWVSITQSSVSVHLHNKLLYNDVAALQSQCEHTTCCTCPLGGVQGLCNNLKSVNSDVQESNDALFPVGFMRDMKMTSQVTWSGWVCCFDVTHFHFLSDPIKSNLQTQEKRSSEPWKSLFV